MAQYATGLRPVLALLTSLAAGTFDPLTLDRYLGVTPIRLRRTLKEGMAPFRFPRSLRVSAEPGPFYETFLALR